MNMDTNTKLVLLLVAGAIGGAACAAIAIVVERYTKEILAFTLIGAAIVYVAFAWIAGAGTRWLIAEMLGVVVYAALGIAGVKRSPWWLVAGWALHPVWDVPLHYFGPGHAFTPESYAIACAAWDWIAALCVAGRVALSDRRLTSRFNLV